MHGAQGMLELRVGVPSGGYARGVGGFDSAPVVC
jgi:hypothetical protein